MRLPSPMPFNPSPPFIFPPFLFHSDIHVQDPDAQQTSGLTVQDQQLIIGAMSYKHKR